MNKVQLEARRALSYAWVREKLRQVSMPLDAYCYIKAVSIARDITQQEVLTELVRDHRAALADLVEKADCDGYFMDSMGAVFDEGEWYIIMDDAGKTQQYSRVPLYKYYTRVEQEFAKALRGCELAAKIARDRAIKAAQSRRQQAVPAGGGTAMVGGEGQ